MSNEIPIPLPSAANVGSGNKFVVDLPVDVDYATIFLCVEAKAAAGGAAITDMKDIVDNLWLKADGDTFREHTPEELRQVNGCNGAVYNTGADLNWVKIHGQEDWQWNVQGAEFGTICTANLKTLRLEGQLKSGLTDIVVRGFAVTTPKRAIAPGKNIVRKVRKSTLDFVSAGTKTFRNLGFKGLVKRWHLKNPIVDKSEFTISGNPTYGPMDRKDQELHLKHNELVPVPGYFVVPFDASQKIEAGLVAGLINESVLKVTVSGAGSVDLIEEYFEAIS